MPRFNEHEHLFLTALDQSYPNLAAAARDFLDNAPPGTEALQQAARAIVEHEKRVTPAVLRRFRGEDTVFTLAAESNVPERLAAKPGAQPHAQ